MKRLLIVLLLVLGSSAAASARDSAQGWCEEGNRPVVTSGLNSTTRVQASHPSCTITVYVLGAGLATIYSDNNNTPLANPFTAQSGGRWQFYANDGRYTVTMSSAGFSQTVTYSDILLCDPFVPGAVCSGAASGAHNLLSTTHLDTIPASPPVRGDVITAQNQTSPTGVNPSWARLPLGTNTYVLTSNGTDAVWAPVAGGGGCTLPGTDRGVISEHPAGTCYDSTHWTWVDDTASSSANGQVMQVGLSNVTTAASGGHSLLETFVFGDTTTVTGQAANQVGQFSFGSGNVINGCSECAAIGDATNLGHGLAFTSEEYSIGGDNSLGGTDIFTIGDFNTTNATSSGSDLYTIGSSNAMDVAGRSNESQIMFLGFTNTLTMGAGSPSRTTASDVEIIGYNNQFTLNSASIGGLNALACVHALGSVSTVTISSTNGASLSNVTWIGNLNTFSLTNFSILHGVVAGYGNTMTSSSINMVNFGIYGSLDTLTNCQDCYAVGENISASANNTLNLGMSASDIGLVITNSGGTHDNVRRTPMPFTSLPSCAAGTEGSFAAITTSNSATNGVIITGGGTNHVLGYCDGTNWKVVVGT